ncbi:MAG: AraC family transcriptional regulator [Candidatus Coproplasma sp.]
MRFRFNFSDLYYAHKIENPAHVSYSDHFHTIYEIMYFIDGDGEFFIENKRYELNPGDLVIIRPGSHHYLSLLSSKRSERYVVRFTEYLIPSNLLLSMENMQGIYPVEGTIIPSLFARFDEHLENVGENSELIKMLYRCVLTEIIVYLCHIGIKEAASVSFLKENMAFVLEYINRNIEKPLCLEDICREFHYSKSYICREFATGMGVPVMQYVRTKKIMYADALLRSGMCPTEVSAQCGFSDYSTFFRMYKKLMGHSPSERRPDGGSSK